MRSFCGQNQQRQAAKQRHCPDNGRQRQRMGSLGRHMQRAEVDNTVSTLVTDALVDERNDPQQQSEAIAINFRTVFTSVTVSAGSC